MEVDIVEPLVGLSTLLKGLVRVQDGLHGVGDISETDSTVGISRVGRRTLTACS